MSSYLITQANPDIHPAFQPADTHRTTMVDLFAAVANDCVNVKLQPTGINVQHYDVYGGTDWTVSVHLDGINPDAVDDLANCYGLAYDDGEGGNYTRIGQTYYNGMKYTVVVYTGRPKDRYTLIREWVAANYSAESKMRVENGEEALPEDWAKYDAADRAGMFGKTL